MAFPIYNVYVHEGRKARDAAQSIVEHSLNASRSGAGTGCRGCETLSV
jgi:hypothetical protein